MSNTEDSVIPIKQSSFKLESGKVIDVIASGYADKISVMAYCDGRISKMYYVPLQSSVGENGFSSGFVSSEYDDYDDDDENKSSDPKFDDSLLPLPHLTPMPLIGGCNESDVYGKIYAAQIASLISRQAPSEKRQVVVGLGVGPAPGKELTEDHRKEFLEVIRLTQLCKVW